MTKRQRYLTTSDAAARLGLSRYTILRVVARGELTVAGRTPAGWARFEPATVEAYARRLLAHGPSPASPTGGTDAEPPRQSAELFRALFEHATDLVAIVDAPGIIRYASPSYEPVLGYAPASLEGTPVLDLAHPDERARIREAIRPHTGTPGATGGLTFRARHADGSWRIFDVTIANRLHDPAVRGIITTARDVTARTHAEEALRQSEERYRQVEQHAPIGLALVAPDGRWLRVNPALCAIVGYDAQDLLTQTFQDITHPDDLDADVAYLHQMLAGPVHTYQIEKRYIHKRGHEVWVLLHASLVRDNAGRPQYCIAQIQDITARTRAEGELRANEERLRAVIANSPVILFALDAHGVYTLSEGRGLEALGRAPGQVVGQSVFDVYAHAPHLQDAVRRALAGEPTSVVVENGAVVIDARHTPLLDEDGRVRGIIGVGTDITARVRAEEALQHQALHDALTGLPNRTLLHDRLAHALQGATRDVTPLALFLMDLDRFKEINDTLGHDAGDALLRHVAGCVRGALRAADTIARLGGDEFAVLLPGADATRAVHTARKLLSSVTAPVEIEGQCLAVGASIGIALHPDHGTDAATLLRQADVAMYAAKRAGGGHALYTPEHDPHSPRRLTVITALHQAITRDELRLYYQPTVDMRAGQVRMVEALVRWQHPEQGLLAPDAFIPLAEGTGLIAPLTRWVVDTAVRQVRAWQDDGVAVGVAVNLSARTLHDADVPDMIAGLLHTYGVPAARLCVEVTESAVMADPAVALAVLTRLAALGVRIAIDDFGTGYSSLAYLKRLPVDEIKLDTSFVTHMVTDSADATIVASTIGLSHNLGLHFVAEGVEDRATWQALAVLDCDGAQGFYISRALPADELPRWLRETFGASGSAGAEA